MKKSENINLKASGKEIYKINIVPQGNRLLKDLLKELILQAAKKD